MLPETVKALREEFAKLHTEANEKVEFHAKEKKDWTAEEKTNQDARYARLDQIKGLIDQQVKLAGYEFERNAAAADAEKLLAKLPGASAAEAAAALANGGRGFANQDQFLRTGKVADEYKFTLTTGSDSSVMLPIQVMAPYLIRRNANAFRLALSFYGYRPLETTTTAQINLPVWDDTSNIGDAISESATTNTTADSTLTGSVQLNATLYESKCKWFSNTLLNAEGFDVLSYVAPVLGLMFDKAQESAYTTTAQSAFTTNNYTVTGAQVGIKYSDLLNWEHKLPTAYRRDGVFVLSDSLYKAFRGMVDNNLRPIIDLNPAGTLAQGNGPLFIEQIHGKPIAVSDYYTAVDTTVAAAGTLKTGLFCSADAIKLRDVVPQRLTRYVNVPTFPDQTGYNLFGNGDCKFVNAAGAQFIY
jgi:HK97 family phage major capsid protein